MTENLLAAREAARLSRLRRIGILNDTADVVLDGFTRLAAAVTDMPVAALTLLDADTLFVKSAVGFPVGQEFARHETFCAEAIHVRGVFEVPDARCDPRFSGLPIVAAPGGLVHYAGAALVLPGGEAIGMLCVASTEPGRLGDRKRMMLADLASQVVELLLVRESEQQLYREKLASEALNLSELSPIGMFSANAEGQVLHGNVRWASMLGAATYEPLVGAAWLQAIHPADRDDVAASWWTAVRERSAFSTRFRIATGHDLRWIRMQVAPVDSGVSTMSFVGTMSNVTETVQLSQRLEAKSHLLESVIEHMPCGLMVFDGELRHLASNPAVRRMLDLPDALFDGDSVTYRDLARFLARRGEYGPGDPDALVESRVQRLFDDTRHAYEWQGRDGSLLEVRARRTPQGLIVSSFNDVTAARKAASELRAARDTAEQANQAKSDFLATMSHEIRTPLNGVIGLTKLLAGAELPEEEKDAVAMIDSCSQSLLSLVDNILDFSKIEAGKLALESVSTDLHQLLREVADVFKVRASDKGLRFKLTMGRDVPQWVLADPGRLRQVLLNLLANALKFTPAGGFYLRVSRVGDELGELAFAVVDTGIGISAEAQERLFERFTQVDASATRRFQGTGLGLAISRQLAQLMEGDVRLQSDPGQGSTFTLSIPLRVAAPVRKLPVALAEARNAQARILLAEDNPINQLVAKRVLATLGYAHVTVVDDGMEALAACESQTFDLVLMDCQMPRMDGLEATRQLRARGVHAPVIAFTASATSEDRDACLGAGMNDYLTKPLEVSVLASKLNRWLGGVTEAAPLQAEAREVEFDGNVLENVFLGDSEMFEQARELFLRNTGEMMRDLAAALATEDWSAVRRLAHKIRGGAGQMGARLLAKRCGQIEQFAGQEGQPLALWLADGREALAGYARESEQALA